MAISGFFVLNLKGEVLISRLFRPDLKRSISDIFRIHVVASSTPPTSPLITLSNTTFFHTRHGGLWLVAVCKHVSRAPRTPESGDGAFGHRARGGADPLPRRARRRQAAGPLSFEHGCNSLNTADAIALPQNANAALVYEFLYRFINLGRSYFGKLDEESVKNNFVSVLCAS